jgi:demethylmenaquinone methyltransferase/2-methoxy-6-polyprenyl-1,4-benzoquinol methylase
MQQFLQNQKGLVQKVFDKVYDKYDLMNDFMSLGIHRIWKKDFMMMMSPSLNKKLIDVGCGTGDISKLFLDAVKYRGRVFNIDPNKKMIDRGKKNLLILKIFPGIWKVLKNLVLKKILLTIIQLVLV